MSRSPDSPGATVRADRPPTGMVVLDLDGTLLRTDGTLAPEDVAALRELGNEGILRVIASGRSPFSYRRALADGDVPIDLFVFSSGAAVLDAVTGRILHRAELSPAEVARAVDVLERRGLDYMIQDPLPDNHRFVYRKGEGDNPDFERRIRLYPEHCRPLPAAPHECGAATQLLVIHPGPGGGALAAEVRAALPGYSIIRATSPIDHRSVWIEIFPLNTSKGGAVAWIAKERGIDESDVLAVGNDFNDLDLLRFAGTSFVVENAPEAMKEEFPVVSGHDDGGVAEAIRRWMSGRPRPRRRTAPQE